MNAYLQDIKGLTSNEFHDRSSEDFIDEAFKAIEIIQNAIDKAQDKMNQKMEYYIDSFGGSECSIRELRGE